MIIIGVVIIVLLILVSLNLDRLVDNAHSTNRYLNDISNKLDMVLENQKKNTG